MSVLLLLSEFDKPVDWQAVSHIWVSACKMLLTRRGSFILQTCLLLIGSDGGLHQSRRTSCSLLLCCHISPVYFSSFVVWQESLLSAAAVTSVHEMLGSRMAADQRGGNIHRRKWFTWNQKSRHTSGKTEQDSRIAHRDADTSFVVVLLIKCICAVLWILSVLFVFLQNICIIIHHVLCYSPYLLIF